MQHLENLLHLHHQDGHGGNDHHPQDQLVELGHAQHLRRAEGALGAQRQVLLPVEGEGQRDAFMQALRFLQNRISLFLALPLASLDDMATRRKLKEIGQGEGASTGASE